MLRLDQFPGAPAGFGLSSKIHQPDLILPKLLVALASSRLDTAGEIDYDGYEPWNHYPAYWNRRPRQPYEDRDTGNIG